MREHGRHAIWVASDLLRTDGDSGTDARPAMKDAGHLVK
jgi:hypothetical protein